MGYGENIQHKELKLENYYGNLASFTVNSLQMYALRVNTSEFIVRNAQG